MSAARVVMADDWLGHLREAEQVFLDVQLGPDILADAKRYVPVDTARLQSSLDYMVHGGGDDVPELHVGSYPDDEGPVEYALAVEFGFLGPEWVREYVTHTGHVVHAHTRMGNSPEQPYLRPALYQERYQ